MKATRHVTGFRWTARGQTLAYTLFCLSLPALVSRTSATPGGLDPSFNVELNSGVYAIVVQANGKILIGGGFTNINGATRYCIARLNSNGSLDGNFDAGTIAGYTNCLGLYQTNCFISRSVRSIALQPDGKILIGGVFVSVADVNHKGIARLNVDGSLDESFDPGTGVTSSGPPSHFGQVKSLAVQSDAKVLLVGDFDLVNGTNRNGIARLNADGSLDETVFDVGDPQGQFESVVVQTDGKIAVGGLFGDYSGLHNNIARFNSDGSLDTNFDSQGVNIEVASMVVQADGKLLVGGGMGGSYNGQPCAMIGRLQTNGVVDGSFSSGANGVVNSIAVQPDGRVLAAGGFTGTNHARLARLQTGGQFDLGFNTGLGLSGPCNPFCPQAYAVAIQADGKVLVGGSFTTVNGTPQKYLTRLFGDELPKFTTITVLADGCMEMAGQAATNAHLRLESSGNLLDWSPVGEFVNTNGAFHYTDSNAVSFNSRFYRAVWLP